MELRNRIALLIALALVVCAAAPAEAQTAAQKKKAVQIAFFQLEAQGVEQRVSAIVTDMLLARCRR